MCGLVGFITDTPTLDKRENLKFFVQGLIADSFRGMDATGVMWHDRQSKKALTYKRAYPGTEFCNFLGASKAIEEAVDSGIAIGHNRAKTFGMNSHANAHPHTHGPITLVHNGSLTRHYQLTQASHAVDTAALADYLSTHSVQDVIDNVTGAYTILWHDERDNSLNFLSNGQRDFAMAQANNGKGWYFASEGMMLDWLLTRNKIKIGGEVFEAPVNTHFKWNLSNSVAKPVTKEYTKTPACLPFSSGRRKAKNRSYGTGSRQRPTDLLKAAGLRVGQTVKCWPVEHKLYSPSSKYGYIDAYMVDKPHYDIIINSVTKEEWDKIAQDTAVEAEVLAASRQGRDVVIRTSSLRILPPDKSGDGEKKIEGCAGGPAANDGDSDTKLYMGPSRELLTRKEFDEYTKHGCDNCGVSVDADDHEDVAWTHDRKPICSECALEMIDFNIIDPNYFTRRRH